ncbi:cytidine deaminase [Curtobacterium sp. PhB130]|uniref:ASCH domain-containing protein n=1 Tax=unclassified Curtobacterium TaxID=257496 RepID=UPI000FA67FAB|nr:MULTISPECIES: ASCH domain-containing protein [unclassified Curtobacterium]ROS76075.1 cytidine deaminase [Curtobacterium sp. PhB130]TCK64229.1 cytidine deaminase [Curtobacterium sp. PhB136]
MLWRTDRMILDAATAAAARLPGDGTHGGTHTVAAAAIDLSGRVHTAANVFHFTGGPCAELAVLGAAAAVSDDPVMAIVAVGDGDRGVLAPCGRCRQVLLDLHPHVLVLVPGADAGGEGDGEPVGVPVRTLLPHAYAWPDRPAPRIVRFNGRYRNDVLAGRKTATIRHDDPQGTGPTTFVFEDEHAEEFTTTGAVVESVVRKRVDEIDADDARDEHAGSVADLRAGLLAHYPSLGDDDLVEVARFRVVR